MVIQYILAPRLVPKLMSLIVCYVLLLLYKAGQVELHYNQTIQTNLHMSRAWNLLSLISTN